MKLPSIFPSLPRFIRKKPAQSPRKKHWYTYLIAGAALLGIIGIAMVIVFIVGIPGYPGSVTAVILTNIPETAAYADIFNVSQDRYRILLSYTATPARDLRTGSASADIVIGKDIGYSDALDLFQPLDYLFHEGGLFQEAFYRQALALGSRDSKVLLLPVSFDLPAFLFRSSDAEKLPSLAIPVEQLREIGGAFNVVTRGAYSAMGFSPLWYGEFLPILCSLYGASFRETDSREVIWDEKAVNSAIQYAQTWIRETNGGIEHDTAFREKYLYDPGYRLIRNGRVEFAITTGSEFFLMPEENRESLDFRWIERDDRISVSDTITFLGVPKKAKHKAAAEEFIRWFFQAENQKRLIETARLKQIRTFGIAGGFSSLIQVNEMVLPQIYPLLLGHVPSQNYFFFPSRLPPQWDQIKKEVLIPWLVKAVSSETEARSGETLQADIRSWRLSEGEY